MRRYGFGAGRYGFSGMGHPGAGGMMGGDGPILNGSPRGDQPEDGAQSE